ncbi:hypothetical protein KAH27_01390, partial [bacterium]|nr:hypothetical protein [bacterium]
ITTSFLTPKNIAIATIMLAGSYLIPQTAKATPDWNIGETVQTNSPSYDFKNTIIIRNWGSTNSNDNIKEVRFPAGRLLYSDDEISQIIFDDPSTTNNKNFVARCRGAPDWIINFYNDITAPSWILTNKNTDVSLHQNYNLTPTNFNSNIDITNNTPIHIDKISILNAEDIQSLTNNQGWLNFLGNTSSLSNGYLGLNDSIKILFGADGGAVVSNITSETGKIKDWTNYFSPGITYQSLSESDNINPGEGETIEFRSILTNGYSFVGESAELIGGGDGGSGVLTQEISTVSAIPEPGALLFLLSVPCTFFKLRGKRSYVS